MQVFNLFAKLPDSGVATDTHSTHVRIKHFCGGTKMRIQGVFFYTGYQVFFKKSKKRFVVEYWDWSHF